MSENLNYLIYGIKGKLNADLTFGDRLRQWPSVK